MSKNNIHRNGFVFVQETHSLTQDEKKVERWFQRSFFSHGVAIGFCRLKSLHISDKKSEENS